MAGRSAAVLFVVCISLVAFLLLVSSTERAHALSWKIGYAGSISDTTPGANADIEDYYLVGAGHSNWSKVVTSAGPSEWYVAPDSQIPNGAAVGYLQFLSTLSILNGTCTSAVSGTIPFFDATTNETDPVVWVGDGANMLADDNHNGLPNAVDQYPSQLNRIFSGLKARARYFGYTNVVNGAPATQLNFVIFNPGQFVPGTGWPGLAAPEQQMGDAWGYTNFVVQDNPVAPPAVSATTEFCAPLFTITTLWGKTHGQGHALPEAGAEAELSPLCWNFCADNIDSGTVEDPDGAVNDGCVQVGAVSEASIPGACANAIDDDNDLWVNDGCAQVGTYPEPNNVGTNNDPADDSVADDGCMVIPDKCGDGIDNDTDGMVDEDCYVVRAENPATYAGTTSGIYGGNTHLVTGYSPSMRDADGDGISNPEDSCPYLPDRATSPCGPTSRECPSECGNGIDDDNDGYLAEGSGGTAGPCNDGIDNPPTNGKIDCADPSCAPYCDDGCGALGTPPWVPPIEKASMSGASKGIGLICLTSCAGGAPADDCDNDGYQNRQDNCPLVANASQTDDDGFRCNDAVNDDAADDSKTNDGCPQVGNCPESGTQCDLAVDDDGDGVVNDGCPLVGAISEACYTTDGGPCVTGGTPGADGIGKACDTDMGTQTPPAGDKVLDGAFATDMDQHALCIGGTDTDGDGWCDADELALGSCASDSPTDCQTQGFVAGTLAVDSTPEYTGIDYKYDSGGGVYVPLAHGVCNDFGWYVTAGDVLAAPAAGIDNDKDGLINGADPGCAAVAGDTDGDTVLDDGDGSGIIGDHWCTGRPPLATNCDDNCISVYNPAQVDSDRGFKGAAVPAPPDWGGDACDPDDDGDGVKDIEEWKRGSDSKNVLSPRALDMDLSGHVSGSDSGAYNLGSASKTLPGRTDLGVDQCKVQQFTYDLYSNVGVPQTGVNQIRVWFAYPVIFVRAVDQDGVTWTCKMSAAQQLGCTRPTGTLDPPKKLTITAMSCLKKELVCWRWTKSGAPTIAGGSWNFDDLPCRLIPLP